MNHIPWLGNYTIMGLYTANVLWLAYNRMWGDVWYWLSALSITACVTFAFTRY